MMRTTSLDAIHAFVMLLGLSGSIPEEVLTMTRELWGSDVFLLEVALTRAALDGNMHEALAAAKTVQSAVETAEGPLSGDLLIVVGTVVHALSGSVPEEVRAAAETIGGGGPYRTWAFIAIALAEATAGNAQEALAVLNRMKGRGFFFDTARQARDLGTGRRRPDARPDGSRARRLCGRRHDRSPRDARHGVCPHRLGAGRHKPCRGCPGAPANTGRCRPARPSTATDCSWATGDGRHPGRPGQRPGHCGRSDAQGDAASGGPAAATGGRQSSGSGVSASRQFPGRPGRGEAARRWLGP